MAFHPIAALREKIASLQERWRDARQEIERLRRENEDLRQDREQLKQEKERLREDHDRLRQEQDRLRQEQERLRQENERLKRQLEEAQRANKRQAAPFSRRQRKENPQKPAHADVVAVLRDAFHLKVHRSTICRAVDRVARRGEATWHALRATAQRSMVDGIDETGWNVAAQLRWLWVVVSEQVTICDILPGRGFEQAASLLGADYEGWLNHDGWAVYYKFLRAAHQSCISHLIRRCRDMLEIYSPTAAQFPLSVKAILEKGLALRNRYGQRELSTHGLWTATGRLEAEMDRLLARSYRDPANQRLANHLRRERPYLFTFLYCPGLDATNNAAERALRPLVVARKNWGGNRTDKGARAQAVLSSILATARQLDVLIELLVSPDKIKVLDMAAPSRQRARSPGRRRKQTAVFHPDRTALNSEGTLVSESVVFAALPGRSATIAVPA